MIADKLAKYANELRYADLPDKVVHEVKRRFLDSLGCAVGARAAKPVIIAKTIASRVRIPALWAFYYGTMIRYLDYNDSYITKDPPHPSDNLGAVWAVAEAAKASGRDAILGAALAYELQCRLNDAASLRAGGWDHVIYGLVSSGLAAGKLMKLSQPLLMQTVNLALAGNFSSRQVRESTELSMWKACAFANVARNAIFAAMLAKEGMSGPNEIFEGKYGLMKQITGLFTLDIKRFGKRKSHFKILDCWIKKWPAEIHSQSAIQAALELRSKIKLSEIDRIVIETHEAGHTIIGSGKEKWNPQTKETADHSLPYIVAAAFVDGKINANTFSLSRIRDQRLLLFMKKISVRESPALTKLYPGGAANKIIVRLKSGKMLEKRVDYQKGHPKNPMSDRELEEKFDAVTKPHLSPQQQKQIISWVWNLEKQKNLIQLTNILRR